MPQAGRNLFGVRSHPERKLGRDIASLLSGAWRATSPPSDFTLNLSADQLAAITPLLCHLGAGALAWCKISNTPLRTTAAGRELHEVYRRFRLSALIHEREIAQVFSLLRAEGIEAVLVKGWAIARRYPDPALRPYGDIDVCVAPAQFAKASEILKRIESIDGPFVDLHCGFGEVGRSRRHGQEDDWEELLERSQVVMLAGQPIRILGDEDHLRVLCLHLLRSGARRPTWLCDIALLVEEVQSPKSKVQSLVRTGSGSDRVESSTPRSFNWDVCLGRNPTHANWVATAIKLAHQLLGASIENTPFARPKSKVRCDCRAGLAALHSNNGAGKSRLRSPPTDIGHWTLDIGLRCIAAGTTRFAPRPRWADSLTTGRACRIAWRNQSCVFENYPNICVC